MNRRIRRVLGVMAVGWVVCAMFVAGAPVSGGTPGGCNDFEDWWENDPLWFFDDPHHMADDGPHPETQEPDGEWRYEGLVPNRLGVHHSSILHFFTADSEEHPSC